MTRQIKSEQGLPRGWQDNGDETYSPEVAIRGSGSTGGLPLPTTPLSKNAAYTTAQTGVALWTPAAGKRIVLTHLRITTGGTTAGLVQVWFGALADTTFSTGVDDAAFEGEFAPGVSARPGAIIPFPIPKQGAADFSLKVTSSAAMTLYVQADGYEA